MLALAGRLRIRGGADRPAETTDTGFLTFFGTGGPAPPKSLGQAIAAAAQVPIMWQKRRICGQTRRRTMLRIWLMAMLAAVVLVAVRDHDVLRRTGLVGYCTSAPRPAGAKGEWRQCRKGVLDGRPNLTGESCSLRGQNGSVQFWSCPAPVDSRALG
jgi:hypothetical protein